MTCHQSGHTPPPAESRGGWPLSSSIRHSPPAESLGNQVGRVTFIFLSSWGLEAHTTLRNGCRCHRHCDFWCVVWFHGTCGIQTSRRVSRDYIWPELRRFTVHPRALPYPNQGVVWRSVQSVFTRLLPSLLLVFLPFQNMCICMLSLVGPSLRCGLFFPRGDANRIQRRLESPCTCSYSLVQPGPVPEYRFYCLSARDTLLPDSL